MNPDFDFAFRTLREDIAALKSEVTDQQRVMQAMVHQHAQDIALLQESAHSTFNCGLRAQVEELLAERDTQRTVGRWVVAVLAALVTLIGVAFEGLNYWRR